MKTAVLFSLSFLALSSLMVGCGKDGGRTAAGSATTLEARKEVVSLPPPRTDGFLSLEEVLNRRTCSRNMAESPLSLEEIGQLLWAAGGKGTDGVSGATRTAPSAGGIYPLQLYLVYGGTPDLGPGVYVYDPTSHSLVTVSFEDRREELARAALGQEFIARSPACVVITADYGVTERRYGERGIRYVHMDAGFAAQNLELQAISLGLGTVPVGAFEDGEVASILGTDDTPLLLLPVGRPGDR